MCRTTRRIGILASLALLLSAAAIWADWPQWRGPNRDAKVPGFLAPKTWPKTLTQKWTTMVGSGVSSPDLVGDKLYIFGRIEGDEATTCLDASTGKMIWQDKYPTAAVGGPAQGYGGPRGTPAIIGGKVYTVGVNGMVSCLDTVTGKVVWRKDTKEAPQFKTSTSPLVADGKCIVFLGALTAFDAATGEEKWKGPSGTPYGSPALMTVDGAEQVVTPTTNSLAGVSLADGKVLWQVKLPGGGYNVNYGTPIIDGHTIIYDAPARGGRGTSMALNIEKTGDGFKATELWKSTAAYQYNTPVLKDGLLFGLSPEKTFFCMDAKSGKGKGGGGKGGFGGEVAAGDAELIVFEPSSAGFKEIAKYKLSPGSGLAYPILAGNRVYVKGNRELTLWGID